MKHNKKVLAAGRMSILLLVAFYLAGGIADAHQLVHSPSAVLTMPGGSHGIGFDDLGFSSRLDRVLVPAGATGDLDLINPATLSIATIGPLARGSRYRGGHGEGVTSVAEDGKLLFATDRTNQQVIVVDAADHKVLLRQPLQSEPDYVRYLAAGHEVWVTEPDKKQIEVFALTSHNGKPVLRHDTDIAIPGGPEALVFDHARQRAYTNLWHSATVAINTRTKKVVARWHNTCQGSRGLALAGHSHLLVACTEGKVAELSTATGRVIATIKAPAGIDIIAYSTRLHHLYVPGAKQGRLAVIAVSGSGKLHRISLWRTAKGAHCVATNGSKAFVCDPSHGKILVIDDHDGNGTGG
ncbi:MAG TPA: PQQ-binding-like beta-propeller repeat protein [Gammaproteobacteria bacterium]|jgi:hypothetical protein|nr:PQQ-binding-like beta-propeller repeat protein [Gammaproteobacteria bacterium]